MLDQLAAAWNQTWAKIGDAQPDVGDSPPAVLALRLLVAFGLGVLVATTRTLVRSDGKPTPGLRTTLLLLTMLVAVLTEVIGNNAARAFGLAGALAVVRFRTVVEDTRDSGFVIFAMVIGMAVGAGYLFTALIGTAAVSAAALVVTHALGPPAHDGKLDVRVKGGGTTDKQLLATVSRCAEDVALTAAGTGKEADCMEYVFRFRTRPGADLPALVTELKALPGVEKAGWELK